MKMVLRVLTKQCGIMSKLLPNIKYMSIAL
jgi:hypothetical protein